jgi:anti-sigma factor RsiW
MSACDDARPHLRAIARGERAPADVAAHVASCEACTAAVAAERALDRALADLPRTPAPAALRAKLAAMAPRPAPRRRARAWWLAAPALVAAAIVLIVAWPRPDAPDALVREAVDDHLRVVYAEHPLDVAASDMHAVKPWFTGRLDFAPILTFTGDETFTLDGGAVGVFLGRRCAVIAWHKRLHRITLLVVPAAGLDFPDAPRAGRDRGFATLIWRRGDLGYALVSDVDPADLAALASKLAPAADSR